MEDIFKLCESNTAGKDVAERLHAKHWMGTNFKEFMFNFDRLKNRYAVSVRVTLGAGKGIPVREAMEVLDKAAEPKAVKQVSERQPF